MRLTPAATEPLTGNGLRESKLPSAHWRTRPPLGACGFTQSNCWKSGPNFGVPTKETACFLTAASVAKLGLAAETSRTKRAAVTLPNRYFRAIRKPVLRLQGFTIISSNARYMAAAGPGAKLILVHFPPASGARGTAIEGPVRAAGKPPPSNRAKPPGDLSAAAPGTSART